MTAPDPANPDEHPPPPPRRRRRRRWLGLLAPFAAAGLYAGLFAGVPAFRAYTLDGFAALGWYEQERDPGCKPPIFRDGRTFLWGGRDASDHFDVTTFRLELDQLHYGLGRERFPALLEPAFITRAEVEALPTTTTFSLNGTRDGPDRIPWLPDHARVLAVEIDGVVKVYPLKVLRPHEVINDEVAGVPIFVAYCYLAELAAAYDRRHGDDVLTFAVSGYTYYDEAVWDGRDAFVLWDRDTESLWWPPIGRAVSGPLVDEPLTLLDERRWTQTTYGDVKRRYESFLVLAPKQPAFTPPETWPRLDPGPRPTSRPTTPAPRWPG